MHQVAEYGVAAHWRYKEGLTRQDEFDAKVAWLRQLMDWQKDDVTAGAQEFVDSLKKRHLPGPGVCLHAQGRY